MFELSVGYTHVQLKHPLDDFTHHSVLASCTHLLLHRGHRQPLPYQRQFDVGLISPFGPCAERFFASAEFTWSSSRLSVRGW